MTLVKDPDILILDEPLNYLDIPSQEKVIQFLRNSNSTILVSTHNLRIAQRICDRILILSSGKIVWEGKREELERIASNMDEDIESVVARIMGG